MRNLLLAAAIASLFASAAAAHKIVAPRLQSGIADSFAATPGMEWNELQQRGGKYQEIWTIDGDDLNKVTFYGGVPVGKPLFREQDRKDNPLPKVTRNMLITDIPALLEATYHSQFHTSLQIGKQDAAMLAGHRAIKFSYTFMNGADEVQRRGEGIGAFVGGKLYLVTYEAPALYFYDRTIAEFRKIAASLEIRE